MKIKLTKQLETSGSLLLRTWMSLLVAAVFTSLIFPGADSDSGVGQISGRQPLGSRVEWTPVRHAPGTSGPAFNPTQQEPTQQEPTEQDQAADKESGVAAERDLNAPGLDVPAREGHLVQVRLPITAEVARSVGQVIQRHADAAPVAVGEGDQRPVLIVEFDTSNSRDGSGSDFAACLSLARLLTSSKLDSLKTVAFIPAARGILLDAELDEKLESRLVGHAVLVALACSEIVMDQDAAIGEAGVDEEFVDELITTAYRSIAGKRLALPVEMAVAMVDPQQSLVMVRMNDDSVRLVDQQTAEELESTGRVFRSDPLSQTGALPLFSSEQLSGLQLIRQRTNSRRDISLRFNLSEDAIEGDPTLGEAWQAAHIQLDSVIDEKTVTWTINALKQRTSFNDNLLIVTLDTDQVDTLQAIRLARQLAEYDSASMRTVAFVPRSASGGAAVIALACDHLVLQSGAMISASGDSLGSPVEPAELAAGIKEIARLKDRDWSLFQSMVDPTLVVARYRNPAGQVRLLCDAEREALADSDSWTEVDAFPTRELRAELAEQYFVARYVVEDFAQLCDYYQLDETPQLLKPTMTDRWLDDFASFLASPFISFWLVFGAAMFLFAELSQPGLGVPGFIGGLCLVLFFWSQFLDGNVQMLEILLFVCGVICLLIEIFLVPGMGIFGVGGAVMLVISLILASQSFLWPQTPEEMRQMPYSVLTVFGGFLGLGVALFIFRNFLDRLPFLNRLMLAPPAQTTDPDVQSQRESVADFSHLAGQSGTAVTPLVPSGKARIGERVVDVLTDGRPVERGALVRVRDVRGNRIVVEEI